MNSLRPVAVVLIALCLGSCGLTANNLNINRLVSVGEKVVKASSGISEQEEIQLGQEMVAVLLGAAPLYEDPVMQRYVNKVGTWVAMQSSRPNLPWTFAVINTTDINAFAMPGGYVLLTRGLMENINSESELAGILAHEITHVVNKHHINEMERQRTLDAVTSVASQAADLYQQNRNDGTSKNYYRDKLIAERLLGATQELYAKGLSKDDELSADAGGVALAARAGYEIYGLPAGLQTLTAINPDDSHLALLFQTHPDPDLRLNALLPHLNRLEQQDLKVTTAVSRFQKNVSRRL